MQVTQIRTDPRRSASLCGSTRQFADFPVKITGFAMLDSSNTTQIPAAAGPVEALNARVFRTMATASALAAVVCAFIAPWRVTAGLLLGGLLALFSHRWLKNSATAAISFSIGGGRPRLHLAQFVLRYVVIGAIVVTVHTLDLISLPAVLVGLSSFVVAILVEATREFYFAITKREED